jgi:hypothetical protein
MIDDTNIRTFHGTWYAPLEEVRQIETERDALRKAIRAAICALDAWEVTRHGLQPCDVADALRAALEGDKETI